MSAGKYYLGIMSGTSADGIDLALVDFTNNLTNLVASDYVPYSEQLKAKITQLYQPNINEIDQAFALDAKLAQLYATAVNQFLDKHKLNTSDIVAIGNHGQTVRHRPNGNNAFTLQLGCNQRLASLTGIEVIGQFRQKDIALGGQGAPLVPAFHQHLLSDQLSNKDVFIVNIGGIANITYLPSKLTNKQILGFDTGPGNGLLDEWFSHHHTKDSDSCYDNNGDWAASGKVSQMLLAKLEQFSYFNQAPPKSTGREIFNLKWLNNFLTQAEILALKLSPEDIQATLAMLTVQTIAKSIKILSDNADVYLCGGGVHNLYLKNQLDKSLYNFNVNTINKLGFDGDALEAMAFAWLAYAYKNNFFSNIPAVTGAQKSTTLGVLFTP